MRKLDNISSRQTYRWKARFVGFLVMYSVSTLTSGFMRNEQKVTILLPKLECKQQTVALRAAITAAATADGQLPHFSYDQILIFRSNQFVLAKIFVKI